MFRPSSFLNKNPPHDKTRHCAASTGRSHAAPEILTQVPAHLGGTLELAPKEMPVIRAISFKIIYKTEEFPVSVSGSNQLFPAEIPGEANCFSLYRTATASAAKPGDCQEPKCNPRATAAHLVALALPEVSREQALPVSSPQQALLWDHCVKIRQAGCPLKLRDLCHRL